MYTGDEIYGPPQPPHMGWRYWSWSPSRRLLISHMYRAVWRDPELTAVNWDGSEENQHKHRLVAGIHALRVPPQWWKAKHTDVDACGSRLTRQQPRDGVNVGETAPWTDDEISVHGIVEYVGSFVLGTDGWRAEHVFIREFLAPTTEIALQLELAFPDIPVRVKEPEVRPDDPDPDWDYPIFF